jgi:transcription termination factor Rho
MVNTQRPSEHETTPTKDAQNETLTPSQFFAMALEVFNNIEALDQTDYDVFTSDEGVVQITRDGISLVRPLGGSIFLATPDVYVSISGTKQIKDNHLEGRVPASTDMEAFLLDWLLELHQASQTTLR